MFHALQWLGGGCYLLNKIFLAWTEDAAQRGHDRWANIWRITAWVVYLIGLPPWVIIFVHRQDWIAASVEAGGAPAMVLGLVIAINGSTAKSPVWLDRLAFLCIPIGIGYSLYDFGGLRTFSQVLELGLALGFLTGTYQLAKQDPRGYLWYVLMHISCGWLMANQGFYWLAAQQAVSLLFIIRAYVTAIRRPSV